MHRPNAYIVDSTHNTPSQTGWLYNDVLSKLRLDPLEVNSNTKFYIHDVRLTGVPRASGNNFTLAFDLSDPEGGSGTVSFYYDNDQNGFNGTQFGSANYTLSGNRQYTFSTSSVPSGAYYIYAKVTDGFGNEHKVYSDVPILFESGDCIQQNPYIISGVIPSNTYRALSIQSDGTINSGSNVQMYGESNVTLGPGFESQSGSSFIADISGCN